jgi:gentisate 1,2-dioxygenase
MQFINPATGGPAMPTMAAFVQFLPQGFESGDYRCTDGSVFHVIEGRGTCVAGDEALEFGAHDTFVVPSWVPHRFSAARDTVLFSYSDRPVQQAMHLWRERRGA